MKEEEREIESYDYGLNEEEQGRRRGDVATIVLVDLLVGGVAK